MTTFWRSFPTRIPTNPLKCPKIRGSKTERRGFENYPLKIRKCSKYAASRFSHEWDRGFHFTDTQKITQIEKKLHSCGMAFPTAMHIFTQRKTSAGAGTEVFLPRKGNAYEAWGLYIDYHICKGWQDLGTKK